MRAVATTIAVFFAVFTLPAEPKAEPGWFVTFTNSNLDQCFIDANTTGPVTVYVVSRQGAGLGGARFRLIPDPGLNLQYISEYVPDFGMWVAQVTGNANDGVLLEGAWSEGPLVLLVVQYFATAAADPCTRLRIGPYPGSSAMTAEVLTPDDQWTVPTHVYDIAAKPCAGLWCELSTPVESSTWGAIKALYR